MITYSHFLKSKLFRFSILAIILALIGWYAYNHYFETQYQNIYMKNANYKVQIGMFNQFRTSHADVVMLGNSLTYNANWNELLGRKNIANRGINADIITGYLQRLSYVYRLHPKLCFIEGGVNDLYANYSVTEIFDNYSKIIDTLRAHNIIPVIQSTLCVADNRDNAQTKNEDILKLDNLLFDYARKQSIEYLDINSLVSQNGFLKSDLSYDGLHLNAEGYALWVPEVEKVLLKYGL
jgi:lysophospholipase L1-like esterase